MHKFRPTRASPPSKSLLLPDHSLHTDISRSSVVSVPELTGLTEQDVELLDTVIQRAGHSATTFLTVFKAYNDVLNERGLDPHEVLYYGKLLKLGTLKGKNWGDKWSRVKTQYSYQGSYSDSRAQRHSQSHVSSPMPKAIPGRVKPQVVHHPEASFTLYSRADESELEMDQDSASNSLVKSRQPVMSNETAHIHDIGGHPQVAKTERGRGLSDAPRRGRRWEAHVSDTTEEYIPSTTPPSYRAALRDPHVYREQSPIRSLAISTQPPEGESARKAVALARERRGNVVNEQDAWSKIKMERDERDADIFWSDRLLERCWEVWKQGFQWIIVRYIHSPFDSDQGLHYHRRPISKLARLETVYFFA
jgi:protein SFI1